MIKIRRLDSKDDLGRVARLIYQVDPYICPDFFGTEENAEQYGTVLFSGERGIFEASHILVAEDTEEKRLVGVLIYADNKIPTYDPDETKHALVEAGVELPENFDRANTRYMKPVTDEARALPDGVMELELLAVDRAARGQGIAQKLFNEILASPEYNEWHLTVLADNPPALHLYKKNGFRIVSAQTGYPDDSVKTFNMVRKAIPVEVSARHVHLSRRLVNILFGAGYELTPERPLSQPGDFLSKERLTLVSADGIEINNVAILGPTRAHTQVEISLTDAKRLGIKPSVSVSGKHDGTASCTLVGPKGKYMLDDGVLVSQRHLHLSIKRRKPYS